MNILITGSNGYIGSELVSRLEPAHNLICIDKKTGKDINDLTINDLEEVEVVINLAASTSVFLLIFLARIILQVLCDKLYPIIICSF